MSIKIRPIKELPEIKRKVAASEYDKIIEEFLADEKMKYALVENPNIKVPSLAVGFKTRIAKKYQGKVTVRIIGGKCYLEKI